MKLFEEKEIESMELIDGSVYFKKIAQFIGEDTKIATTDDKQALIKKVHATESCFSVIFAKELTLPIEKRYQDALELLKQLYREVEIGKPSLSTAIWACNYITRLYYVALCNAIIIKGTLVKTSDITDAVDHIIHQDNNGRFVVLKDFTLVANDPEQIVKNFTSIFDEEVYSIATSNGEGGVRFFDNLI